MAMQLRLPQDKREKLLALLTSWLVPGRHNSLRRSGFKRELLSLICLLNHAAKVVKPGRAFLRGLIDASTTAQYLDFRVHLNSAARQDIAWWHTFITDWNGVCILPPK